MSPLTPKLKIDTHFDSFLVSKCGGQTGCKDGWHLGSMVQSMYQKFLFSPFFLGEGKEGGRGVAVNFWRQFLTSLSLKRVAENIGSRFSEGPSATRKDGLAVLECSDQPFSQAEWTLTWGAILS